MKNKTWFSQILTAIPIVGLVTFSAAAAETENNVPVPANSNLTPAFVESSGSQPQGVSISLDELPSTPAFLAMRTNLSPQQIRAGMNPTMRPIANQTNRPPLVIQKAPSLQVETQNPALQQRLNVRPTREAIFEAARGRMLTNQIAARGGFKKEVMEAISIVPRHNFIPAANLSESYQDEPVNIGHGRNIESPYTVASIVDQLDPKPTDRVLELGTGSGYQAAVLSLLVKEVYTMDTNAVLTRCAEIDLQRTGCTNNVFVKSGDLSQGWPEAGPFDAIIFKGDPSQVGDALKSQLKEGGRLIIPDTQGGNLHSMKKLGGKPVQESARSMRPMTPAPDNTVDVGPVIQATKVSPK